MFLTKTGAETPVGENSAGFSANFGIAPRIPFISASLGLINFDMNLVRSFNAFHVFNSEIRFAEHNLD